MANIFRLKTKSDINEKDDFDITNLEKKLQFRKAAQDITNRIYAAQNIREILIDLKDGILTLFDAYSLTIYVANRKSEEIYSMFLTGSTLQEIRVPINSSSIAGYVAKHKTVLNITDAYDNEELIKIDSNLSFDASWDRKSGIRTTQILSIPILYSNTLMGVLQILNKKSGNKFDEEDQTFLEEISSVLGIALHNQERIKNKKRSKFDYLLRYGVISVEELELAWDNSKKNKSTIEDYLMDHHKIPREDIGKSLAEFYSCNFIGFNEKHPPPFDLLKDLKEEYLRREMWVPLERRDGKVRVIVDDPYNILKKDMIESLLKTRSVEYDVALYDDIIKYIKHFYRIDEAESSINELIDKLDEDEEYGDEDDEVNESDSIIMQLVNRIINDAYMRGTSDIHIEPNVVKKYVEVRFRIDGDLSLYQAVPFSYRSAMVSRIKIMSNLNITERRKPQDGKIKFRRPGGQEIELRVATIPTQGSVEDVVMRILAKGETMPLEEMNMSSYNYENLTQLVEKPYGMILCVGPTGSGKTTTLHAALHHINRPEKKIWTAEDPVEITQNGLRQVQVNPKIGFDFSAAMRAFLRADPDVIMVGEMRDYETAKTGVEASLTGHLVFSTLHTNSAPETIVRLLDMGIDPLNFADSLLGILAQRLVRTLCKECKEEYHATREEYDELAKSYGEVVFQKLNIPYNDNFKLYRPKGCSMCEHNGYKGRVGIHELLVSTDEIKNLIQKHENVEVIRNAAIAQGMTTLLQDGILKIIKGVTDFQQVRKVCIK